MTKLQEIVKKAKALKKAYPKKYSKWTDYVKAASKLVPKSKTVGATKRTTTKKTATRSPHKDTRSHNVNVKVVSGIKNPYEVRSYGVNVLKKQIRDLEAEEMYFDGLKKAIKIKSLTLEQRQNLKSAMEISKRLIASTKSNIRTIKKNIQ